METLHAEHSAARECAAIAADLERLKALITEAGDRLADSFAVIGTAVGALGRDDAGRGRLSAAVHSAVTALQFQDMATQLIAHAQHRLNALQDDLRTLGATAEPLAANTRLQPVKQAGMTPGSIDLFF
jgi:hypothetical protein